MIEPGLIERLAIKLRRLNVHVLLGIIMADDHKVLAAAQVDGHFVENRTAHDVIRGAGIHSIKTHRAEDVPGGAGSLIVHTGICETVLIAAVEPAEDLSHELLGLPGRAGIVIEIGGLPIGLVALDILADHAGAVAADAFGMIRSSEKLVELGDELLATAEEIDQALDIVWDQPERGPSGSFFHHEVVVRLARIERRDPRAVGGAAAHEADGWIEDVLVVEGALEEHPGVILPAEFFGIGSQGPIVPTVFESLGDARVARGIRRTGMV